MLNFQPLDLLPIWGVYLLTVVVLLLAFEAGYQSGVAILKRRPDQAESGVGTMVGASLAFLGFMLAFIIGIAVNIFNERNLASLPIYCIKPCQLYNYLQQ